MTLELNTFNKATTCLKNWCLELELPIEIRETKTNEIALKIFNQNTYVIKEAFGHYKWEKTVNLEEWILDLELVDSKGEPMKWVGIDSHDALKRTKEFYLYQEIPNHPNHFYQKIYYLLEESLLES